MGCRDAALDELADALWRAEIERAPIAPLTDSRPRPRGRRRVRDPGPQRRAPGRGGRGGARAQGRADLAAHAAAARCATSPPSGCCSTTCSSTRAPRSRWTELVAPRVEAEIAFVMAGDLTGPGVTTDDALAAIGGALPAHRGGGQPDRRLADPARRHRRRQRVVGPGRARRRASPRSTGWTCGCSGCCSPATAPRSTAARARPRSATRPAAWPGWPTRSPRSAPGCAAATSCCPGALHRMVPVRPGDAFPGRVRPPRHRHACGSVRRDGAADRSARHRRRADRGRARRDADPAVHPQQPVPRHGDRVHGAGADRRAPAAGRRAASSGSSWA